MGRTVSIAINVIAAVLLISALHSVRGFDSLIREAVCQIPEGMEQTTKSAWLKQCLFKNFPQDNKTLCYDELGCFPMGSPWISLLRPLPPPIHPAVINVRFYCYSRESPERNNIILWPTIDLGGYHFNSSRKTAFIVHGFASTGNFSWMSRLKDNYLALKDSNVCLVDWGSGAQLLDYLQVASNTRIVGAELARYIKWLIKHKDLDPGQVHLMGHSLGAHICSYAAKRVPGIWRITAMDPAQPGFEGVAKRCRLDKSDAKFVEVLHTNASPFIPFLGFGMIMPHGHVDIYFNGGQRQPGCSPQKTLTIKRLQDLINFSVETIGDLVACSHARSYEYYTAVLRDNCIIWCKRTGISRQLLNGMTMGYLNPWLPKQKECSATSCIPLVYEMSDYPARGMFAAMTSNTYPYCETNREVNKRMMQEIRVNKGDEDEGAIIELGGSSTVVDKLGKWVQWQKP